MQRNNTDNSLNSSHSDDTVFTHETVFTPLTRVDSFESQRTRYPANRRSRTTHEKTRNVEIKLFCGCQKKTDPENQEKLKESIKTERKNEIFNKLKSNKPFAFNCPMCRHPLTFQPDWNKIASTIA